MKKLVIDRFDGNDAVCEQEDKTYVKIEKSRLPKEASEGSCIIINADGSILMDDMEYKRRKSKADRLMEELFE